MIACFVLNAFRMVFAFLMDIPNEHFHCGIQNNFKISFPHNLGRFRLSACIRLWKLIHTYSEFDLPFFLA